MCVYIDSFFFYLILIEVCNDNAYKQSESNHTTQKHKDVDVDAVDLQAQFERLSTSFCNITGEKMRPKVPYRVVGTSLPVPHGE